MTVIPFRSRQQAAAPPNAPGRWRGRLWVSDAPLDPGMYRRLVTSASAEGLWPLVILDDEHPTGAGQDWIADRGWDPPSAEEIPRYAPEVTLARQWEQSWRNGDRLAPFGQGFPGIVRRSTKRMDPVEQAAQSGTLLAITRRGKLGLVGTGRAADIPALLGWRGARTVFEDAAELSAVLRSWEERFGALLIGLGHDELVLSVAAPPTTSDRALGVAAEHLAFCDRPFIYQPSNFREFSRSLLATHTWRFRWS